VKVLRRIYMMSSTLMEIYRRLLIKSFNLQSMLIRFQKKKKKKKIKDEKRYLETCSIRSIFREKK
jgi:hypothetical protein